MPKWARMRMETGKAYVDPSAMRTQTSEVCHLHDLVLTNFTHKGKNKAPENTSKKARVLVFRHYSARRNIHERTFVASLPGGPEDQNCGHSVCHLSS